MTTIRLYWNNICVLHRQELQFLNEIREELRKDNIDLDITCFGLGYGRHMSDYLRGRFRPSRSRGLHGPGSI